MTLSRPSERPFCHVDTWVFDLDNTLYPARHNLFELIDRKIGEFIVATLRLDSAAARRVQKSYFREYGATLRGLMLNHGIDPVAFLDFVHQIDVSRVPPNPELDVALERLNGRKLIFTNASARHAEKVIARLGVAHHFDAIFDIRDAGYIAKPDPASYAALVERHAVDPRAAAMIDDIARNLAPAAELGMVTVWVRTGSTWGQEGSDADHIDVVVDDLADWLTEIVDAEPGF